MRNSSKSEKSWLSFLEGALRSRLDPLGWTLRLGSLPPSAAEPGVSGGVLILSSPDQRLATVRLEFKQQLEPRSVPDLERVATEGRPYPLVVGAPFLSPRVRNLLTEARIGYADLTGNLRITLREPALYIEAEGARKNPSREPRPLQSLKGRAVARVLRALCDFRPPYTTTELAERSRASVPTASRVVNLLKREKLLTTQGRGLVREVEWAELIREWSRDYSVLKSNVAEQFLAPRGLEDLRKRLASTTLRYAATASLAARIPTSVAPVRLAMLYVDDPMALRELLDLRPAEKGANAILLEPFDPVVFERSSSRDGIQCAAFSQVAVDLLTSPGRGPSEAEELLRWMDENESAWRT